MAVEFIVGVIVGVATALIIRRPARRAWGRIETWLARKLQSLMTKKTN